MARPTAPVNVVATEGHPTLIISWDASAGAAIYSVYRANMAGNDGAYLIGRTDELTWTDLTAVDGVSYWYSVSAGTSDSGCSDLSEQDSGFASSAPISVPDVPVILFASVT